MKLPKKKTKKVVEGTILRHSTMESVKGQRDSKGGRDQRQERKGRGVECHGIERKGCFKLERLALAVRQAEH